MFLQLTLSVGSYRILFVFMLIGWRKGYFFVILTKALFGLAMALPGPMGSLWFAFLRD